MMLRQHEALRSLGVDSHILCRVKTVNSPQVHEIKISKNMKRLEYVLMQAARRLGFNDLHCLSSYSIGDEEVIESADVVHIHGIHGNFFSYLALPALTKKKPTLFSLHDMWCFTGHCASSYDCERWKTGCGNCPYPQIHPPVRRDTTRLVWKLKKRAFENSPFEIAVPSRKMLEQVEESTLKGRKVHYVPLAVDTEIYRPTHDWGLKQLLGIGEKKKVVLFCTNDMKNHYKGGDLLLKALAGMSEPLKRKLHLLILGKGGQGFAEGTGIEAMDLGYISNERLKAAIYSLADVFVHPTRSDNFPLVILESLACGTPVVSFMVGGIPDMVRPGLTGYLARFEDVGDFANGMTCLLEDDSLLDRMRDNCRETAVKEYDLRSYSKKLIDIYGGISAN